MFVALLGMMLVQVSAYSLLDSSTFVLIFGAGGGLACSWLDSPVGIRPFVVVFGSGVVSVCSLYSLVLLGWRVHC